MRTVTPFAVACWIGLALPGLGFANPDSDLKARIAALKEADGPANDPPSVAPLRECLSALGGSLAHWPSAKSVPADHPLRRVLRHKSYIHHPYVHEVHESLDGRHLFVVEVGGIANTRHVFGPLAAHRPCDIPTPPRKPGAAAAQLRPQGG